jgi:hypothetical protein
MSSSKHTNRGVVTGGCMVSELVLGGIFMENLKMEKQRTGRNYGELAKTAVRQGFRGTHAGLIPWGVVMGFGKGFVLGGSMSAIQGAQKRVGWTGGCADIASGVGSGAIQGAALTPMMLARTIVNENVTSKTAQTGIVPVFKEMLNRGIMTGGTSVIGRQAGNWGCRLMFMSLMSNEDDSKFAKLSKAFVSGVGTATLTLPIDTLIPITQSGEAKSYHGGKWGYVRNMLARDGVSILCRGYVMRCLYVGYHTVWAVGVCDIVSSLLNKP